MLRKVTRNAVARVATTSSGVRLHRKYRDHTMIPRRRFIESLNLAARVEVRGDLVECGTWKGGMIAALAERVGRRAVLFDSFEGLPDAKAVDGAVAIAWQSDTESPWYHDNCTADERDAIVAMTLAGAEYEIRKGWFEQTVPAYAAQQPTIAIMHLDGDWYDSIVTCSSAPISPSAPRWPRANR